MKRISLRLSDREHEAIVAYANYFEISLNEAIREAIRNHALGKLLETRNLDRLALLPHPADAVPEVVRQDLGED